MNNRFVGDIGDYVKLAILRRLALDRRLGVAWWFTDDEPPSAHQGHREYLERPQQWRHFDAELFEKGLCVAFDLGMESDDVGFGGGGE